jgi:hypothetical protein
MSEAPGESGNAAEREVEMREHEREARERESSERDPSERAAEDGPAAPANPQRGNLSGG